VWWKQFYTNVIEDVALECTEYNGTVGLVHERFFYRAEPQKLRQKNYHPALNMSRELRWIDKSKPNELLSNDDVAQNVMEQFLALVDRLNRGKISGVGR
jgi:hypothetical protein